MTRRAPTPVKPWQQSTALQPAVQRARRPPFLELPEDVLDLVILRLPFVERVRKAPLVCKQLHALSKSSKQQWAEIVLPTVHIRDQAAITRLAAFVRWLEARAAGVRALDLAIVPSAQLAQSHARVWRLVSQALSAVAPSIVRLHLEWLGMLVVGEWAARMRHIEQADFIGQRLVVGAALRDLPRLQDLWLVGDSITYYPLAEGQPPAMSCLPPSITALSFSRASLRQLPPGIASLTNLISLDLSYSFPDSELSLDPLSRLTALQELTCSWCRLRHVPRQLSALTSLRVLYLHECFAGDVPSEEEFEVAFRPLQRLGMLSLSSCRLRSVPRALLGMTSLRGLHLEDNRGSLLLPPGPYLGRLVELVIDWSTLFGSHSVLRDATQLTRLYASGSHRVPQAAGQGAAAAAGGGPAGGGPGGLAEMLGNLGGGAGWVPPWHPGGLHDVLPPLVDDNDFVWEGAEGAGGAMQQEEVPAEQPAEGPPQGQEDAPQEEVEDVGHPPWPAPPAQWPAHVQLLGNMPPPPPLPEDLPQLAQVQDLLVNLVEGPEWEGGPGVVAGEPAAAEAAAAAAAAAAGPWGPGAVGAGGEEQWEGAVGGLFAQAGAAAVLGMGGMAPAGMGNAAAAAAGGGGVVGGAWWPEAPPVAQGALAAGAGWAAGQGQQADEAQAQALDGAAVADVAASLAAMPALRHFVDVFPPGRPVYIESGVAQLMYLLPQACPRLDVKVLESNSFGWRLADLLRREEEEEEELGGG